MYGVDGDSLRFVCPGVRWYGSSWEVKFFGEFFTLKRQVDYGDYDSAIGRYYGVRNTELRFHRVTEVQKFEEFEDLIVGSLQLYKIKRKNEVKRIRHTKLHIGRNNEFSLVGTDGLDYSERMDLKNKVLQ